MNGFLFQYCHIDPALMYLFTHGLAAITPVIPGRSLGQGHPGLRGNSLSRHWSVYLEKGNGVEFAFLHSAC